MNHTLRSLVGVQKSFDEGVRRAVSAIPSHSLRAIWNVGGFVDDIAACKLVHRQVAGVQNSFDEGIRHGVIPSHDLGSVWDVASMCLLLGTR